ncbi:hypothetical protein RM151_00600 [Pantoea agglomerans]|uniref:hypothetical protein n=1 Tax=Enterobacter agglomerans TaxID=549 RepID=UPI0028971463|nr:hypothetical protein [Pantoea agglomerans]WNK58181.1 hypothetical protein RM151_00600 [Pantoea agglomerans]
MDSYEVRKAYKKKTAEDWKVTFKVNSLFIIDLLGENDAVHGLNKNKNTAQLICDGIDDLSQKNKIYQHVYYVKCQNKPQLIEFLTKGIKKEIKNNLIPHLHFEFHGDEEKGLQTPVDNQYLSWGELNNLLLKINKLTKNNLGVFLLGCHGVGLRKELKVVTNIGSPYGFLIFSKAEIFEGQLKTRMKDFYRLLFIERELDVALEVLQEDYDIILTKHTFSLETATLFYKDMFGKNKDNFTEFLVSKLKLSSPIGTPLRLIRRDAKARIKKMESFYSKAGQKYLHGQMPIPYDTIYNLAKELYHDMHKYNS